MLPVDLERLAEFGGRPIGLVVDLAAEIVGLLLGGEASAPLRRGRPAAH